MGGTLGLLFAIEAGFSGNGTYGDGVGRSACKICFSPIWIPLNFVRAAFGVVAMVFATVPTIVVHFVKENAEKTPLIQQVEDDNCEYFEESEGYESVVARTENGKVNLADLDERKLLKEHYWEITKTKNDITAKMRAIEDVDADYYKFVVKDGSNQEKLCQSKFLSFLFIQKNPRIGAASRHVYKKDNDVQGASPKIYCYIP